MATTLDDCRDTAQQIVTALLAGDRDTARRLAEAFDQPLALALTIADLTAMVHHRWARAIGVHRGDAWRRLMLDVARWRETR